MVSTIAIDPQNCESLSNLIGMDPKIKLPHRQGTNILYLSNLPPEIMMQDIIPLMSQYGVVEHCTHSRKKGYAFVKMCGRFAVDEFLASKITSGPGVTVSGGVGISSSPVKVPKIVSDKAAATTIHNALIKDLWPHLMPLFKEKIRRVEFARATGQGDIMTPLVHNDRWSEHLTPDGTSYYYDCHAGKSQWSLPPVLAIAANRAESALNCPFLYAGPLVPITFVLQPHMQLDTSERERLIFVGHIPVLWGHSHVTAHFSRFGQITDMWLQRDRDDKMRGFGYIQYETPSQALAAAERMDGYYAEDRMLSVERVRISYGKVIA